tara:strand:+ start:2881 stop:3189 length:309 start_codon:yes stop_codon:yes gene_type:complete
MYGDEAKPNTFRAYAAVLDGEVLGVAGLYYTNSEAVAFSHGKPGAAEKYPVTAARLTHMVMKLIRNHPCKAVTADGIDTAPEFLERLGFKHLDGKVWLWATN